MTFNNKNGLLKIFLDHSEKAIATKTISNFATMEYEKCRGKEYDFTVGEMRHGWLKPKFQIGEIVYKELD